MRTAKKILAGTLCACLCALLCGCELLLVPDGYVSSRSSGGDRHQAVNKAAPAEGIGDRDSLYSAYDSTDPVCFYVTVTGGNAADGTDHTLEEVNSYLNLQGMTGVEKIKTEIILQVGDEEGPREGEFGFGALSGNATMNVRGRTSTGYPQKSYRISLFDGAGLWRGQKAIALNKHPADVTRIRNMLYFRLLEDVPSIPSLRTQFVHLWVRDLTAEDPVDEFVDYGLFTQVELPNNRYLRNHGLSVNGNLYKANMCEMYRYPDNLKLAADPGYDPDLFGEVLEPKTGDDHAKLLRMLDAVNDYSLPAEELLGKYFDEDNLTSYLAFNLLMGNPDSNAQNYLLYSPIDSERWYYLCWDGDGCLKYSEYDILGDTFEEGEWDAGRQRLLGRGALQPPPPAPLLPRGALRQGGSSPVGGDGGAGEDPRGRVPEDRRPLCLLLPRQRGHEGDGRGPGQDPRSPARGRGTVLPVLPRLPRKADALLSGRRGARGRPAAPDLRRVLRLRRRIPALRRDRGPGLDVLRSGL